MLDWLVALCALVLVVLVWPGSKYSLVLQGPAVSQQGTTRGEKALAGGPPAAVSLVCKRSALASYLQKHCRSFSRFSPPGGWTWRASGLLQSLVQACWPPRSHVHFVRDHLQLSDDGLVALDWAVPGRAGPGQARRRRTSSHSGSPVLLIIPNSFGRITRTVLELCETALSHGFLPAVFNRRSHNETPLSTVKLQPFGDPADLREAVAYIRHRRPTARLYAVSESSGSGLLLSYLGECGSSSYLTAAGCLSPVFRCQSWFESGLCRPLQWALVEYQKTSLSRYKTVLAQTVQTDSVFSSRSLRGLEESLFCQGHVTSPGAPPPVTPVTWESYWDRNDPLRDVDEVAIPVLSVCSRDDPIRGETDATIPLELFETNPHFFLLLTDRGGHCGFASREGGGAKAEGGVAEAEGGGAQAEDGGAEAKGGGAEGAESHLTNWSHQALLDFFRATTDFFLAEERSKQLAARRRGLNGATRHRSVTTYKRLPACSHDIHNIYSWQRSYTR